MYATMMTTIGLMRFPRPKFQGARRAGTCSDLRCSRLRGSSAGGTLAPQSSRIRTQRRAAVRRAIGAATAVAALVGAIVFCAPLAQAGQLSAGAAKVDITNREAGPINDPLYAKALVMREAE